MENSYFELSTEGRNVETDQLYIDHYAAKIHQRRKLIFQKKNIAFFSVSGVVIRTLEILATSWPRFKALLNLDKFSSN